MAKKSSAKKTASAKKTKLESGLTAVTASAEFDDLTEDQLRNRAQEDMRKLETGEDVDTQEVRIHRPVFIREAGGKVHPGAVVTLPESVIALYLRSNPETFSAPETASDASEGDDGGEDAENNDHAPEGDQNDTMEVQEGDKANNNVRPGDLATN